MPPAPGALLADGGLGEPRGAAAAGAEEARPRAAQMEKTMRWWSDCTGQLAREMEQARERNRKRARRR